jgi:hypothetical protein
MYELLHTSPVIRLTEARRYEIKAISRAVPSVVCQAVPLAVRTRSHARAIFPIPSWLAVLSLGEPSFGTSSQNPDTKAPQARAPYGAGSRYLNQRYKEILCPREIRHNVDIFTKMCRFGLRCSSPRRDSFPVGQRVARSLPERWPAACRAAESTSGSSKRL